MLPLRVAVRRFFDNLSVEYFNHCMGAAHSKSWSKYSFYTFFMSKSLKIGKNRETGTGQEPYLCHGKGAEC